MPRGGRRVGAGRPPQAEARRDHDVRVPVSEVELACLTEAAGETALATWLRELGLAQWQRAERRRLARKEG